MSTRRSLRFAITATLATICVTVLLAAGEARRVLRSEPESTHPIQRIEFSRGFARPWESACEADVCKVRLLTVLPVTTPADTDRVNMTCTVTIDYRATGGRGASATLAIDDGTPPYSTMRPGTFHLAPSKSLTTATFLWLRRGLPGKGARYRLVLSVFPEGGGKVIGTKLAMVVETWADER
jgi:hypothetical protein